MIPKPTQFGMLLLSFCLTLTINIGTANAANLGQWSNQNINYSIMPTPDLARMDDGQALIDRQQNLQVGEWALRQLNGNAPLIQDPWLQQSLEQLVWQINAVAGLEAPLGIVVIDDRQINAFAVPSGLFGMNIGLLDKAKTLDELISVVAHEIAHVSQRHYQHRHDEKTKQLLLQAGGILAGVAAAKVGDGNASTAVLLGSQAVAANASAAYSRAQEREADRIGMQLMRQAGYDVNAMPNFFTTLDQQNPIKNSTLIPSFMLSHPLTADRLSEARSRATRYDSAPNQKLSRGQLAAQVARQQLFDQLQWRGRYLGHLVNKADLIQGAKTSEGAKLALIEHYLDNGEPTQAASLIKDFEPQIHNAANPLAVIIYSRLLVSQGNIDQAITKLTQLATLYPERMDIPLYISDIYLDHTPTSSKAQAALSLLQPLSKQRPRDVAIWDRLAKAAQQLAKYSQGELQINHQINMLRYRAYSELWRNQLQAAVTSLSQAQQLTKNLGKPQAVNAVLNQQINQVQQAHQFKPN